MDDKIFFNNYTEELLDVKNRLKECEQRFRIVSDYSYDWENWVGPDGKLIWVNSSVLRITGYTADECLIMADFPVSLVHEDDRDRAAILFGEAVRGLSGDDVEARIICKDGSIKWVSVSWRSVYDDDGACLGHRSSIRDITKRKLAEEMLRKSEENFHNIFNNSPIGIYQVSPVGRFIRANRAAGKILGYDSPEELMNSITDIATQVYAFPEDRVRALSQMREHGYLRNFEVRCRHKDGSVVWVLFNARLVRDGQDNILYHEGTSQDITKRKLAEEQIDIANKRFVDLLDSIDAVVYVADMETYEILFINKYGINIWGNIVGKVCWQTIQQNQDGPCSFCTNDRLVDAAKRTKGITIWEFQNTKNRRWYECRDKAILWPDGRIVRMEIAVDITERKNAEEKLRKHRDHLGELVSERTKELEQNIVQLNKIQNMLGGILDSINDYMIIMDEDYNIVWMNEISKKSLGKDAYGQKCHVVIYHRDAACDDCIVAKTFQDGNVHDCEKKFVDAEGNTQYLWCTSAAANYYPDGQINTVLEVLRDITSRKLDEETLKKREAELASKSRNLEEMNIALKVLLEQRDIDKKDLEEKTVSNIKRLITPYINKLKETELTDSQKTYLSIIGNNLNNIISPYLNRMSIYNFTPKELEVTLLIREGKTTKEIARLMNVCKSSVDLHRYNIRTKLGLNNKKTNLRSYLMSLS